MRLEDEIFEACLELATASRQNAQGDVATIAGATRDRLLRAISRTIMDAPDDRTDSSGRARAGSQLQTQLFVNLHPEELSNAIFDAAQPLRDSGAHFRWVSPLTEDHYQEYRDREFLQRVGLDSLASHLAEFWPARGPRWDALALIRRDDADKPGVLMVEAKSHPAEVQGGGCGAGGARLDRITLRLDALASKLGIQRPECWLERYYQSANRLAHLCFLRDQGVDAWLANVYFADDWHRPTSTDAWKAVLEVNKKTMGLDGILVPAVIDVIVPAKKLTATALPAPDAR